MISMQKIVFTVVHTESIIQRCSPIANAKLTSKDKNRKPTAAKDRIGMIQISDKNPEFPGRNFYRAYQMSFNVDLYKINTFSVSFHFVRSNYLRQSCFNGNPDFKDRFTYYQISMCVTFFWPGRDPTGHFFS